MNRTRRLQALTDAGKPQPSELANKVSLLLRGYRFGNRLTQQELGEVLGMKQSQIARLESGFVNPSLDTLVLISERIPFDLTVELKSGEIRVGWVPR
jgi:transcriptional regulator with XRE-family HTH domain